MTDELTPEFLDRWVAEKVMGWELIEDVDKRFYGHVFRDKNHKLWMTLNIYGYGYPDYWRPSDATTGQIWMVVDRLRRESLYIELHNFWGSQYWECRIKKQQSSRVDIPWVGRDLTACIAILKAAHRALGGSGETYP